MSWPVTCRPGIDQNQAPHIKSHNRHVGNIPEKLVAGKTQDPAVRAGTRCWTVEHSTFDHSRDHSTQHPTAPPPRRHLWDNPMLCMEQGNRSANWLNRYIYWTCETQQHHHQPKSPTTFQHHISRPNTRQRAALLTDTYLFCLHKDPKNASKLRPIGIPTAIWQIMATHIAQQWKDKFTLYLLPYNFAVGKPNGMDFCRKPPRYVPYKGTLYRTMVLMARLTKVRR